MLKKEIMWKTESGIIFKYNESKSRYTFKDNFDRRCIIIDYPDTRVIIKKGDTRKTKFYGINHITINNLVQIQSLTFSNIESVLDLSPRILYRPKFEYHRIIQRENRIEFQINGRKRAHITKVDNRFHIQMKGKYCMIRLDNIKWKKTYVVLEYIKDNTMILKKRNFFCYPDININLLKDFLINNPDFRMKDIRSLIIKFHN